MVPGKLHNNFSCICTKSEIIFLHIQRSDNDDCYELGLCYMVKDKRGAGTASLVRLVISEEGTRDIQKLPK